MGKLSVFLLWLVCAGACAGGPWDGVDPVLLQHAKFFAAKKFVRIAPIVTYGWSPKGGYASAASVMKQTFRDQWTGREHELIPSLDALRENPETENSATGMEAWRTYASAIDQYLEEHKNDPLPTTPPQVGAKPRAVTPAAAPPARPTRVVPSNPVPSARSRFGLR